MKIVAINSSSPVDVSHALRINCACLDSIPKPGFWGTNDQDLANKHWLKAKDFLKSLRAAQERMEHTHVTLVALLAEIDQFIDQCRQLDANHRKLLKDVFSRNVISFAPPPRIENGWLFHAIKERLRVRMRYIEKFMEELRSYNSIVREIRHYHDINLIKPFIGEAYIEGFPSKKELPNEVRIS